MAGLWLIAPLRTWRPLVGKDAVDTTHDSGLALAREGHIRDTAKGSTPHFRRAERAGTNGVLVLWITVYELTVGHGRRLKVGKLGML